MSLISVFLCVLDWIVQCLMSPPTQYRLYVFLCVSLVLAVIDKFIIGGRPALLSLWLF